MIPIQHETKFVSCIKIVAKDVLGESRVSAPPCKDTSWWNKEVKAAIKIKRDSYRDLKKIVMERVLRGIN